MKTSHDFFLCEQKILENSHLSTIKRYLDIRFSLFRKTTKTGGISQVPSLSLDVITDIFFSITLIFKLFLNKRKKTRIIFSGPFASQKHDWLDSKLVPFIDWLDNEYETIVAVKKLRNEGRYLKKNLISFQGLESFFFLLFCPFFFIRVCKISLKIKQSFSVPFVWIILRLAFKYSQELFYTLIFKLLSPNEVFVNDAYGKCLPIVRVCRRSKIHVCEYQHGVISSSHVGYAFKYHLYDPLTEPDQIWVWSGHEASILKTYRSHSVIRHLKKKDHKTWLKKSDFSIYKDVIKIVFIGQPSIECALEKLISEFTIVLPERIELAYKLHPRQSRTKPKTTLPLFDDISASNSVLYVGGFSTLLIDLIGHNVKCVSISELVPDGYLASLTYHGVPVHEKQTVIKYLGANDEPN